MYSNFEYDKALVKCHPSSRQMIVEQMEFYAFAHFTVNTFTDKEWGDGTEPESVFNPTELDANQWVDALKSAGIGGLILTCKHHDGFCLWPSAYTEHSVKNSPYKDGKGDVVKEVADACRKGGIKFGVYLSPWDRNCRLYGTDEYNDYFCNQLTELLTQYGDIFTVWFDGACGEGPNGKRQVYDWSRYYALIRELQPDACIAICGPDIRWCGNEAGDTRPSEWSVLPTGFADPDAVAENSQKSDDASFREKKISEIRYVSKVAQVGEKQWKDSVTTCSPYQSNDNVYYALRHDQACNFLFVDAHAEKRKWYRIPNLGANGYPANYGAGLFMYPFWGDKREMYRWRSGF